MGIGWPNCKCGLTGGCSLCNPQPIMLYAQGWQCPKCDAVFAPFITQCYFCNEEEWVFMMVGNTVSTI